MGLDMSKNRVTVGFFNGLLDTLRESALSITQLDIKSDGSVSLRCLGDSGHLPAELITT